MQTRFKFAAALALAATVLPAQAQFKPEEVIAYRQGIMKAQRWNLVPIAMMVQGKMPYDQATLLLKARRLDQVSSMAWDAFGPGTQTGAQTRARPEVWSDPAGYKQAADALQAETQKLVAAAQSGNMDQIKSTFGGVAKSCDNCHDKFRSK